MSEHRWGRRTRTVEEWRRLNPLMKATLSQVYLRRTGHRGKLRNLTAKESLNLTDADEKAAARHYLMIEPDFPPKSARVSGGALA